jgi:hypothetical protein
MERVSLVQLQTSGSVTRDLLYWAVRVPGHVLAELPCTRDAIISVNRTEKKAIICPEFLL